MNISTFITLFIIHSVVSFTEQDELLTSHMPISNLDEYLIKLKQINQMVMFVKVSYLSNPYVFLQLP